MADWAALEDANRLLKKADGLLHKISTEMRALDESMQSGEKTLRHIEQAGKTIFSHIALLGSGLAQGSEIQKSVHQAIADIEALELKVLSQSISRPLLAQIIIGDSAITAAPNAAILQKSVQSTQSPVLADNTRVWDALAQDNILFDEKLLNILAMEDVAFEPNESAEKSLVDAEAHDLPQNDSRKTNKNQRQKDE